MLPSVPKIDLKVISVRDLTDSTFVLRVERGDFQFRAGQFVNLGLPGSDSTREYSLYSGTEEPWLDFLIREVPEGAVSPLLRRLPTGALVTIDGPYDEMFTIKKSLMERHHVFVATGTGISPFHSFVTSHPGLDFEVVHGVRHACEQYDAADYVSGRYTACISRESGGFQGRVTDYLKSHPIDHESVVYLCGSSAMIYAVNDWLVEIGFPMQSIYSETFF